MHELFDTESVKWTLFSGRIAQVLTFDSPHHQTNIFGSDLLLKQLESLSDEAVILQWKRNSYYQAFCGMTEFKRTLPCDSTELVKFRQRIGKEGFELVFQMNVALHGKAALETNVNIDTTVQEKNVTSPTERVL